MKLRIDLFSEATASPGSHPAVASMPQPNPPPMPVLTPFHLAFPVHDLEAARAFYAGLLGCPVGRSSSDWIDFDLFGHQIVAHRCASTALSGHSEVDAHVVPVPHFGVVLAWETFHALAARLRGAGLRFEIEPCLRFAGQPGEQMTMFFRDPSGNALEFKAFRDIGQLFARSEASPP
jgi:uncharacterized protein